MGSDIFLLALPFASGKDKKSLSFEWSKRNEEVDISGSENKLTVSSSDRFKGFISCDIYKNEEPFFTVYHCLKNSVGKNMHGMACV